MHAKGHNKVTHGGENKQKPIKEPEFCFCRHLIVHLPTIAEEFDVVLAGDDAQLLHDLGSDEIGLSRVGQNGNRMR